MNKYIILTMNISNVGGAEQYVYNKTNFLKKKGFEVFVFSALDRPIIIDAFSEYKKLIIPDLMYSPMCFKKSRIEWVISKIIKITNYQESDVVFVECHNVHPGLWGELIAERCKALSVIFNLQERHNYSIQELDFLRFKLKRKELAGISSMSISQMFKEEIPFEPWMKISAYCNNVVDDCNDKFSSLLWDDADITFGSIGRLEKGCVKSIIEAFVNYAKTYPLKKYNVVMIGGANKTGVVNKLQEMVKDIENLNLIITGFMYPIPRSLLNNIDLFVSTAGSAFVSYQEKRLTIKVHPETAEPVQIMGYTYDDIDHPMFDVLNDTSLGEQINVALSGIGIRYLTDNYSYDIEMKKEFERELTYFQNDKQYYQNASRVPMPDSKKNKFYLALGRILGGSNMQSLLEALRRVFHI